MLGNHLASLLPQARRVTHEVYDLMNMIDCRQVFENSPRHVYNLSGMNGGLPWNQAEPAEIFYQSTQMNLNILTCCQQYGVEKVINVISACSYPDNGKTILKEEELFDGPPSLSTECHGYAKRVLLEYSRQLYKQYGLNSVCVILTNCYGDYDRFDLRRTKVVGATIRRLWDAKHNNLPSVTFYGDGSPVRELMYAGDAVLALKLMMDCHDDPMSPINVGSGQTISIFDLVYKVKELIGYEGEILWNTEKINGQQYRHLCTDKMNRMISMTMTPLEEGLKKAIRYYERKGRFLDR